LGCAFARLNQGKAQGQAQEPPPAEPVPGLSAAALSVAEKEESRNLHVFSLR
jgi:hypothetical protein